MLPCSSILNWVVGINPHSCRLISLTHLPMGSIHHSFVASLNTLNVFKVGPENFKSTQIVKSK